MHGKNVPIKHIWVILLAVTICTFGSFGLVSGNELESELVVRTEADEQIISYLAKTFE
jgi:hypothetical protein